MQPHPLMLYTNPVAELDLVRRPPNASNLLKTIPMGCTASPIADAPQFAASSALACGCVAVLPTRCPSSTHVPTVGV